MNIGIIAHDAHPISEPYEGGLEMITHLLVKELVQRKHSVKVLCLQGSDFEDICEYYEFSPLQHLDAADEVLENMKDVATALNRFFSNDFDVVHNHSLHFMAIIMGNSVKFPFITTFHTPIFKSISIGIKSVTNAVNQTFTTVSKSLGKAYETENISSLTIYNGIDVHAWDYKETCDSNYYSWSGRICKEKGLIEILHLCEQHELPLHFAGPISNKDYYEDEITPFLKSSKYCQYVGHLNQKELNTLLKNSKAYIFSSTWAEPYGLVLAEALASGIPVLANNVGAVPEIINNNCGRIYNLENEASFVTAVSELDTIVKTACRKRALQFCTHKNMVDAYEKLYECVIENVYAV